MQRLRYFNPYIDDLLLIVGDGCDFAFLSDEVKRKGEVGLHLLVEISVVAEVVAGEQVADLRWMKGYLVEKSDVGGGQLVTGLHQHSTITISNLIN